MTHASALLRTENLRSLALVAAIAILGGGEARADAFCDSLGALVDQARAGFPEQPDGSGHPPSLPGATDCALSGSREFHCTWEFPYRDEAAYGTYDAFNLSLLQCFAGRVRVIRDQPVNHPDFYDQRLYRLNRADVTVSIKDKIALSRTFVFVRTREARAD